MSNSKDSATLLTWAVLATTLSLLTLHFYSVLQQASKQRKSQKEDETSAPIFFDETDANSSAEFLRKHPKGLGVTQPLDTIQVLHTNLLPVPNLQQLIGQSAQVSNRRVHTGQAGNYNRFMSEDDVILADIRRHSSMHSDSRAYLRAGPRKELYFEPKQVCAAIVTCGGLCPGLNNVIRDITLSLWNLYGVTTIYGIRGGFSGFYEWKEASDPVKIKRTKPLMLTPSVVSGIHHLGGTILQSNRGGFDTDKILQFLLENNVSQVYIIGGDGTHRGAEKLASEAVKRDLRLSVAGIPKTIDNDVDLLDRSFGFNTSVEEAQRAIRSAKTEANCVPNGIGIVKLMGRSSGFIAAHATLSSGDVNLCLVPEVPIVLDGPNGCLMHLESILHERGNAVIVVAEGAGEELLGEYYCSTETDAGGNKKLPPIGEFLKHKVVEYFRDKHTPVTVKYIDPSYMIRSVAANASDSLYCMLLAQNAVHGAMAGYTAFTVGLCCNRVVYLPIAAVTRNSPRCMDALGRTWERVLCMTRQPNENVQKKHDGAVSSNPPM